MPLRTLVERIDPRADAIYVDATDIYLPIRGAPVLRVARSGGAPVSLPLECKGGNVVADAREVWVVDVAAKRISRWRKDAAPASVVASELRLSGMGMLTADHLWVTSDRAILRIAREGGSVETMLEASEPSLLGADAGHVYFTVGSFFAPANQAGALPMGGGRARKLDVAPFVPGCARYVDGAIYVLGAQGELSATSVTDGSRRALRSIPLSGRPFLTMNHRYVYVGDRTRVPLDGGPSEVLDIGADRIRRSAADDDGLVLLCGGAQGRRLARWD